MYDRTGQIRCRFSLAVCSKLGTIRTVKVVGVAALLCVLSAATAQARVDVSLSRLALTTKQVGAGYTQQIPASGRGTTGDRTMTICRLDYPSEALRLDRLQVNYSLSGVGNSLSNEVVSYRPGGAKQAVRELTTALASCPKGGRVDPVQPVFRRWRIRERLTIAKLLPGYVAYVVVDSARVGSMTEVHTHVDVVQTKGDVLSGIYVYVDDGTTLADAIRVATSTAQQSALNLAATA